jgi:hypothetical protein
MAKEKAGWVKASGWLFVLGIIISIIIGLFPTIINSVTITAVLAILGFIIGLLGIAGVGSIDKADISIFLLAVIALMVVGISGNGFRNIGIGTDFSWIGTILSNIVLNISFLVAPAGVLIALKAIWEAGSTKF